MKNNVFTRKQYMDKKVTHQEFYSQFVTEATKRFILRDLTVEQIKEALASGDEHLNEIKIPYNNMGRSTSGRWWWDDAPINTTLVKEAGDNLSQSTHTCVAKVAARMLVDQELI